MKKVRQKKHKDVSSSFKEVVVSHKTLMAASLLIIGCFGSSSFCTGHYWFTKTSVRDSFTQFCPNSYLEPLKQTYQATQENLLYFICCNCQINFNFFKLAGLQNQLDPRPKGLCTEHTLSFPFAVRIT